MWSVCVSRQDRSRLGEQRGVGMFAPQTFSDVPKCWCLGEGKVRGCG